MAILLKSSNPSIFPSLSLFRGGTEGTTRLSQKNGFIHNLINNMNHGYEERDLIFPRNKDRGKCYELRLVPEAFIAINATSAISAISLFR